MPMHLYSLVNYGYKISNFYNIALYSNINNLNSIIIQEIPKNIFQLLNYILCNAFVFYKLIFYHKFKYK